jgi:acyl carrier protein
MIENILDQLSEIFEQEINDLNVNFKDLDAWDSLTALSIIALADSNYKKQLTNDKIKQLTTIGELVNYFLE